jgi:serine protease Do
MRFRLQFLTLFAAILVVATACGGGKTTPEKSPASLAPSTPTKLTDQQIAELGSKSTVLIQGKLFDQQVGGTGIIIDGQNGMILTNEHVIAGVSAITVTLPDGSSQHARIRAQAPCDDVALIQLNPNPGGLTQATLGDDKTVKVADHVVALGFGVTLEAEPSKTPVPSFGQVSETGISTAPDGSLPKYPSLILHNARLAPGNSGGPLLDDLGQVVGMNTLAFEASGSQVIQGQFYAIGIDHIKQLMPDMQQGKNLSYVGWTLFPNSSSVARFVANLGYNVAIDYGLILLNVDPGSPAQKKKFIVGDTITRINNTAVKSVADACDILQSHGPGDVIDVDGVYLSKGQPTDYTEHVKLP